MFRLSSLFLIIFFVFNAMSGVSNNILELSEKDSIFSEDVVISLLTFGAANEPHSVWGHTAIRIKDETLNIDLVYNYGQFDFKAPFFLMKFLRGKLDYSLAYNNYKDVYAYYKYYKRGIYEQILNLTYKEKIILFKLLKENYKEENRFYKYDFFYDNCSTRPLQIIEKSIQGKLMLKKAKSKQTYRNYLNHQISNHQWMDFGIDLIIGAKADKIPSLRQATFLPEKLKSAFTTAKISVDTNLKDFKNNKTIVKKLVSKGYPIFEFASTGLVLPKILYPIWIFTFFLLIEIVLFIMSYRKKMILYKWYDKTWFVLAFIGGLLITFLWFFTDHQATKDNWNYIWINPLFFFVFLKAGKLKSYIIYLVTALLFITLFSFSFLPQEMHPAIIPIICLLILKVSKYGILKGYFDNKDNILTS